MGKIIGIATRTKTKAPMDVCNTAPVLFETGVGKDSRGLKKGKRQVTVMSEEAWREVCSELNQEIPWTTRRANILISEIALEKTKGSFLKIGTCTLEVTGELIPCNRMDEQVPGLTETLASKWRGGVTCKIIEEGEISLNDEVSFLEK